MDGSAYKGKSKIEALLGPKIWSEIAGKTVIDFGCGVGLESVEMALGGAARVIGVDIQERLLKKARSHASLKGVDEKCVFAVSPSEKADLIIALDSFEHFEDPAKILETMRGMLKPGGAVIAAFGPTWYHPLGGHLFSVFPWAHLIFSEKALIRWRSDFKSDGAQCFSEVDGGLNQMTIARFERLVCESRFDVVEIETVPIRKLKRLANSVTREFTTALVRCKIAPQPLMQF
jgi:SAM-dependent methyltransferase